MTAIEKIAVAVKAEFRHQNLTAVYKRKNVFGAFAGQRTFKEGVRYRPRLDNTAAPTRRIGGHYQP